MRRKSLCRPPHFSWPWPPITSIDPFLIRSSFSSAYRILNKITPEKFDKLSEALLGLGLNSQALLKGVILLIFEKALEEPKYSSMYAQLCKKLSTKLPNFEPAGSASNGPHFTTLGPQGTTAPNSSINNANDPNNNVSVLRRLESCKTDLHLFTRPSAAFSSSNAHPSLKTAERQPKTLGMDTCLRKMKRHAPSRRPRCWATLSSSASSVVNCLSRKTYCTPVSKSSARSVERKLYRTRRKTSNVCVR